VDVVYHPLACSDVVAILRFYHDISPHLEQDFDDELRAVVARATTNPNRFHQTESGFRRANLKRFPYHALYESALTRYG
jgi:plasmid stabilization system protein ParE